MDYLAWRITFQSGDQAARAAFNELLIVKALRAEAQKDRSALIKGALRAGEVTKAMREYVGAPEGGNFARYVHECTATIDAAMHGANT